MAGLASVLCIAVAAIKVWQYRPKAELSEFLPDQLVASMILVDSKFLHASKDAELFWRLAHSPREFGPLLLEHGFRLSDKADNTWGRQSFAEAFRDGFLLEGSDVVYSRDTPSFDVFILAKETRTNSFVMVLKK